jgi:hypothetical protein
VYSNIMEFQSGNTDGLFIEHFCSMIYSYNHSFVVKKLIYMLAM